MLYRDMGKSTKKKIKFHRRLPYDMLDSMADWVRVIDEDGVIIYANKTMEEDIGKSLVGTQCYKSLGKKCRCDKCITQVTMGSGMPCKKEEKVGDKIFSVKSSPVKDIDGNIYAAVEVFRDVTREKQLENELVNKNDKMNKDLKFARALQEKILPKKGDYDSVTVDYLYRPSEQLSGDMFDVFKINDRYTGIYISDVVGHGVTASMMTMFVRQTMRAIKDQVVSPAETLSELHKRFIDLDLDDDQYFTIFYGVIDNYKHTFTYANGGHNSIPLLINKKDTQLLETSGYPISYLFDNIEYNERTVGISKDDKLLLYTDGIIEARNKAGEQFGLDRLLKIVEIKDGNIMKLIEEKIDEFKYNRQEDDLAIVKARVL